MSIQMPQATIDIQDFRFKLLGQVKVFEKEEQFQSNALNLVTSASEYGLIFVAINRGFQVIQSAHLFAQEPHSGTHEYKSLPRRIINLGTSPTHLEVNCLQNYLAVVIHKDGCPHALFYDVTSFLSQSISLINEIRLSPTSGSFVYDFFWNPGTGTSLAVCTSDGSVSLFDFTPNGINIHNLPPTTGARCLSWSPKGKQLVVGDVNGGLTQYKPDLKPAKTIPGPAGGQFSIYTVLWLSNFQFATIMKDNLKSEERPGLFIVNAPKNGPVSFVSYGDICYGTSELRIPQFYLLHIPAWSILVVGSANSIDVGLLGLADDGVTWQQWNPDDSAWASLPLDANKRDTFCVGMTLETSAQKPIQWDDNKVLPPAPLLTLVSHDGILCLFQAINLKHDSRPLCKPSQQLQDLSGLNQFLPLDIPTASAAPAPSPPPAAPVAAPIPTSVQAISQPPAFGLSFGGVQNQQSPIFPPATTPQTSTPSLFGGSNLFGGTSTGFSIGGVSAANSIPSTANTTTTITSSTTAFSSFSGFGNQPAPTTGSLFASSGFFNGTPLSSGTTSASTPIIFSQPASTSSTSLTGPSAVSSGLTLGGSQPFISQAPTTNLSLTGSTQAPGFGSGPFSGFATPIAPTPLPSTSSSTPPPNTSLTLSSLLNSSPAPPPNTSLSLSSLLNSSPAPPFGQLPKSITLTPVAPATVPSLSNPPATYLNTSFSSTFATPVVPRAIKLDQTPIKPTAISSPFQISSTPISQSGSITTGKSAIGGTSLIKEIEKPTPPIITTISKQPTITNNLKPNANGDSVKSKKEIEAESGLSTAVFAAALLDDMKYFNTELSELKTRVQSLDINSIHSGSESLQSRLASLDSFVTELRETTTVQCSEVDALKTELLETFSWHEEAISKIDYFKNPAITQLLELQATDPAAARKLNSIQNLSFHIESQLAQMHTVLDDAWAKKQSAKITSLKDKNQQIYIPINEEILQTLILHTKILATRKVEMAKILDRSRLPVELKNLNSRELIESDPSTSELTRKLQSMGLTSVSSAIPFSSSTSSTGNTKKMQSYIRRLLRARLVVPIRPSRPVYIIKPSILSAQMSKQKAVIEIKTTESMQSNLPSQFEQQMKTNSSLFNNFKQVVSKEDLAPIQKATPPSIHLNINRPAPFTHEVKKDVDFTSTQKSTPPSSLLNLLNRPSLLTQGVKQDVPKEDFTLNQKSPPPSTLLNLLNRSAVSTPEMTFNFNSKPNMSLIPPTQEESTFLSGKSSNDPFAKASTDPAAASPLNPTFSSTTKETGSLFSLQSQTSTTKPETMFSFSKAADDMFKSTQPAISNSLAFNSSKPDLSGSLSQNTFKSFFQQPSLPTTTPATTSSDEFKDKLSVSTSSIATTISSSTSIFDGIRPIDSSGSLFGGSTSQPDFTFSLGRLQKSESVSNLESIVRKDTEVQEEVQNPEEGEDDDDQESVESQPSVIKAGEDLVIREPITIALKDENGSGDANKLTEKPEKEDSKITLSAPTPDLSSLDSSLIKTLPTTTASAVTIQQQEQPLFSGFGSSNSMFSSSSATFSFGGFSTPTTSSDATTTVQPTSSVVTSASESISTSDTTITSNSTPLNLTTPIKSKAEDLPPTPPDEISTVVSTTSTTVTATPVTETPTTVATESTPTTNFSFGDVTKSSAADSATSALASFSFNSFGFGSSSTTTSATPTPASTATTTSSGFGGFGTNTDSTPNTNMFGSSQPAFGTGSNEAANPFVSKPNFGSQPTAPTTGSVFGGAASPTQGSIFGGSGFGNSNTTQNTSVFGSSAPASVFGGQTNFSNTSNTFGNSNTAQPPATNASSIFGAPVSTASSFSGGIFKQSSFTQQQHSFAGKPAFGQPSVFGQQQQSPAFGSPNSGSIFGNAAPATASNTIFGGNMFQSPSNTQPGPFSSGTGQTVAQSGFGSPSSAPTVFGSAQPGGFGGSPVFGGSPSRPTFGGSPSFGAASPQTNVFGSPPNTAGSIFGGTPQQGSSTFETLATSQNTMTFGNLAQQASPTPAFGQAAPPVQPHNTGGSGLFGGQGTSVFNSGGGGTAGGGASSSFGGSSFSSWR